MKFNREQEKEADVVGAKLALERGFDPEEAVRFWDRQHERFGRRSFRPKFGHSLFGTHPRDRVRAENLRFLLAKDLKSEIDEMRAVDGLSKGTSRFGRVLSGMMRDTGALLAERSDRHDLALRLLEKAREHRPNDPRLLWALGRVSGMVARTDEQIAEAHNLLVRAVEEDKRGIYPAIHRDIAVAIASQSDDHGAAVGHLRQYVAGHLAVHGRLPRDIDDVYDQLALLGDNEWSPGTGSVADSEAMLLVGGGPAHPTVWDKPVRLEDYDVALRESTQQIESSFAGALAVEEDSSKP